jgi:hypothetical protein
MALEKRVTLDRARLMRMQGRRVLPNPGEHARGIQTVVQYKEEPDAFCSRWTFFLLQAGKTIAAPSKSQQNEVLLFRRCHAMQLYYCVPEPIQDPGTMGHNGTSSSGHTNVPAAD